MLKRRSNRNASPCFVDTLECRTLMSAGAGPALHPDVVAPKTTTTISTGQHTSIIGRDVILNVAVSASKKLGTPAGTIEFLDGGNLVQASGGPLQITLNAKGRASYRFGVGDVALFAGKHNISAEFISSNSLPDSTSHPTNVHVTGPVLKATSDGLDYATVVKGHGAAIAAGQGATTLYTGFLNSTGAIFDYASAHVSSSDPTGDYSFTVDANPEQVIAGFDQGTLGMKVGETRVLVIPPAIGYGTNGAPPSIPANAVLIFLVKLVSIS